MIDILLPRTDGGVFLQLAAATALAVAPRPASDAEIAAATAAALDDVAAREVPVPSTITTPADTRPATAPAPPATTTTVADTRIPLPAAPTVMVLGESTAEAIEPAVAGWVGVVGGTSIDAADPGCSPMFAEGSNTRWYTNLVADPTACRDRVPAGVDVVLVFDHGVPLFDHFDRDAGA